MHLLTTRRSPLTHPDSRGPSVRPIPITMAGATYTRSALGLGVSVHLIVGMSIGAMRFGALVHSASFSSFASLNVKSVRNWFQMLWSYTSRNTAEMVKIVTGGDRANKYLVGRTMGWNDPPVVPEHAITKRNMCGSPQPARFCFVDLRPETLFRSLRRTSESASNGVVFHPVIIAGALL